MRGYEPSPAGQNCAFRFQKALWFNPLL